MNFLDLISNNAVILTMTNLSSLDDLLQAPQLLIEGDVTLTLLERGGGRGRRKGVFGGGYREREEGGSALGGEGGRGLL